jgi:hypothetical protein
MPGQIGIDASPTWALREKWLQVPNHLAMVNIATVEHNNGPTFADYIVVDVDASDFNLHFVSLHRLGLVHTL